jgi:hypothetical protein
MENIALMLVPIARGIGLLLLLPVAASARAGAVDADPAMIPVVPVARQSLDDAWWTGPILAASAGTLPQGHFLVEPYVYDVMAPRVDGFGSLTYINYGLTDRLTVGVIPTFGYNRASDGPSSSHVGAGDVSVQAQWRLTQFDPDSGVPTMSINVQESIPTGKFDRLGDHPSDGFGSGARTTTLGWYAQTYFWMPNGRILRTRLDIADAFSRTANIEDVSVYGTGTGFRGQAKPGDVQTADLAFEYSVTRNWVLALDLLYKHSDNTRVTGHLLAGSDAAAPGDEIRIDSGASVSFAVAPAVEYNWNANIGLLFGTRVILGTRTTPATVTPVVALNMVF